MTCSKRSVVTRIHCLQHVKSLACPDLSYNNPVRPHPEAVSYQVPYCNLTFAFYVGRSRFHPYQMLLVKLKLCSVLYGNYSFLFGYETGQYIKCCGFSASCSTRYYNIEARLNTCLKKLATCGDIVPKSIKLLMEYGSVANFLIVN